MENKLKGKKVAILVTDGFEQIEFTDPKKALDDAGAETDVVSLKSDTVKGWNHTEWADTFQVDVNLDSANPSDYDALLLPGGVINSDKLRMNEKAVAFVKAFVSHGKPIASICHSPWILIEANAVKDRKVTSYLSLKTDLINAGAEWVDQEVVTDNGLVTSRKPDDIPAFCKKMIEEFAHN